MLSYGIWFSVPSLWMGGGLESRCVGRVYGADGAVRVAWQHPYRIRKCPQQQSLTATISNTNFATDCEVYS